MIIKIKFNFSRFLYENKNKLINVKVLPIGINFISNLNSLWNARIIFNQIILYRDGIIQNIFEINNNPIV